MEEKKSVWPYATKYGFILGLLTVAVAILMYFIFPINAETMRPSNSWLQTVVNIAIGGALLFVGTKAFRDEQLGGHISYGRSLKFMLAMSVPYMVLQALFTFIFFTLIEPDFISKIVEMQYTQMAERGMSDQQIEESMSMMSFMNTPVMYTIFGAIGAFFSVLIIGLIVSIFTRNEPLVIED